MQKLKEKKLNISAKAIGSEFKKTIETEKEIRGKILLISNKALLIELNGDIFEVLSSNMPRTTISTVVSRNRLTDLFLTEGDPVERHKNFLLRDVVLEFNGAEVWSWNLSKNNSLKKWEILKISNVIKEKLTERVSFMLHATDPLLEKTIKMVDYAFRFCKKNLIKDLTTSGCALLDLVGLGPGLTPAGDDALAGFLVGTRYFSKSDSSLNTLIDMLREGLQNKTTTAYSKRLLMLATDGISNEYVEQLIVGAFNQDLATVIENTEKILRLGSTSGYFFLFGFMSGLELSANSD